MTTDIILLLIASIIVSGVIIALCVLAAWNRKGGGATKPLSKEELRARDEERLMREPEIFEAHAEVKDMLCTVNTVGTKQPRAVKSFLIKFGFDDGSILDVYVSEEDYEGFEVGLAGALTLIDGELSSFVPDGFDESELDYTEE